MSIGNIETQSLEIADKISSDQIMVNRTNVRKKIREFRYGIDKILEEKRGENEDNIKES
jgi:hypothetical protein